MKMTSRIYKKVLPPAVMGVMICCCLFFSGCSNSIVKTDVDTEAELLEIMKQSGEYDFYDAVEIDTSLGDDFYENYEMEEITSNTSKDDTSTNAANQEYVNEATEALYVLNNSSKKFHTSECSYAKKIKKENYETSSLREEIISNGYQPCKICNP